MTTEIFPPEIWKKIISYVEVNEENYRSLFIFFNMRINFDLHKQSLFIQLNRLSYKYESMDLWHKSKLCYEYSYYIRHRKVKKNIPIDKNRALLSLS